MLIRNCNISVKTDSHIGLTVITSLSSDSQQMSLSTTQHHASSENTLKSLSHFSSVCQSFFFPIIISSLQMITVIPVGYMLKVDIETGLHGKLLFLCISTSFAGI